MSLYISLYTFAFVWCQNFFYLNFLHDLEMGVKGLLPNLKVAIKEKINIEEFKGSTVAVDTYGWIYRGACGCSTRAWKPHMGE
jgi:hypothetical protein